MFANIVLNASMTAAPGAILEISSAAEVVRPTSRPLGPNGFTQLINVFPSKGAGGGECVRNLLPRDGKKQDIRKKNRIPRRARSSMRVHLQHQMFQLLRSSGVAEHHVMAVLHPETSQA